MTSIYTIFEVGSYSVPTNGEGLKVPYLNTVNINVHCFPLFTCRGAGELTGDHYWANGVLEEIWGG